jgi:putative ABC transport system ATP-binding protein
MFISTENLTKSYQTGTTETIALSDASINIGQGEIGVILGPSGSGKSTLMNILGGIDRAQSGTAVVDGVDITKLDDDNLTEYRRGKIGFIFQSYNLIPHLTVLENIEVMKNISVSPLDMEDVLSAVGLSEKKDRFPRELSGGEQQRVAIARAVVKNPKLLLCDELTGALDYESAIEALALVQDINKKFGTTILIITHNAAISAMANRVFKLRSGKVVDSRINDNVIDARRIDW